MKLQERYIYPPRPSHDPVPFEQIGMYYAYEWKSQIKVNDLRTEFSVVSDTVTFFNRHKATYKNSVVPEYLPSEILEVCNKLELGTSEWSYLDGGMMCCKNKAVSGIVAIWDILVKRGDWLLNTTYQARYDMIVKSNEPFTITINGYNFDIGYKLSEHIFVPYIYDNFNEPWELTNAVNAAAGWKNVGEPVLEGIVVFDPNGKLDPDNGKKENNVLWRARSRVHTGRHRY